MADEERREPSDATGTAALVADWSHGHRDVSGGYLVGLPALAATLLTTAVALAAGGIIVGQLTGRPLLRSGLRQLALGALAIAVTFGVGSLIGGRTS